jgi:hypothetical protein
MQTGLALTLTLHLVFQGAAPQAPATPSQPSPAVEELWAAAREGDIERARKALDAGADINAGNRYKATALFFAADKGQVEMITFLLDRGADINARDTFYGFRPIGMALMNGHINAAVLLLKRGSEGAGDVLMTGLQQKNTTLINAALEGRDLTAANVRSALARAKQLATPEIIAALEKKLASFPAEATPAPVRIDSARLQSYAGNYRSESAGTMFTDQRPADAHDSARRSAPDARPHRGEYVRHRRGPQRLDHLRRPRRHDRAVDRPPTERHPGVRPGYVNRLGSLRDLPPELPCALCFPCALRAHAPGACKTQPARSLAFLPGSERIGQRRRARRADGVGRRERQERQVEDADPGLLDREPDRVGQQGVRRDRDQQQRRHDVPHGPLRGRQAGGRPVRAHVEDLLPR